MMNTKPYRVLMVGCGNIAGVFDQGRPLGDCPLTHAGGYSRDGRFELAACVDPDSKRLGAFVDAWGFSVGFSTVDEALNSGLQFDVVSICSPTDTHARHLEMVSLFKPKLIFCEKPVTTSAAETERLVAACGKSETPLAVNYTRRWDPDITKFKADIQAGRWGRLHSVVGYYTKGILNNGSHMLDLFHLLIGPMDVISVGKPIYDFFPNDPTIPVQLEGPLGVPVNLVCGNAQDYSFFEIQFVFSKGVVTMEEGGMFWRERRAIDSELFSGYRTLEKGRRRSGKYRFSMIRAIDNIYRAISQDAPIASTGMTALDAQRVCDQIKQRANAL